jgi:NAD(P)-dependent dehydrogenase (short-subunit alcohol dehydrogenase family)
VPGAEDDDVVVAQDGSSSPSCSARLRTAASPLGTEGTAWDIAWAIEYLVSDKARWVTGVVLPVDAGVRCTSYTSMAPILAREGAGPAQVRAPQT